MAGQADGTIIVDTELNSEGFKAGSAELQRAVKSLSGKVNNLGPTLHKALSGSESAITSFNAKTAALEDTIAELETKMDALGNATFETADYQKLCAEIDAVSQKLDQLTAKRDKMLQLGVNEESKPYQSLIYDLTELESKYLKLSAIKEQMAYSGTAFQAGSETAEYQRMNAALAEAKSKLTAIQAEAVKSKHSLKSMATSLASGLKSAVSSMARLISNSRKLKSSFSSVLTSVKRIAPALLATEGILGLLRRAVNAYLAENEALANTLKNCWTGIGNLLGPIVERLVNLIATAVAYFTAFLNLLGIVGKSSSKAISSAGGGAAKEADKLKRQLASFDELNILSDSKSDSSGGGAAADTTGSLPEVTLPDWAKLMVDQLKSGQWADAAKTLTTQLNTMVASVDWAGVGSQIGYYLNGALTFLATALLTFDWFALGSDLAVGFNNIITGVDWKNLGTLIVAKWVILIGSLGGFFRTLDWTALGKAFADGITGAWKAIDWAQAARTVSDGVIGVITGLSAVIKNINWAQFGTELWNALVSIVTNIDWTGLVNSAFNLLGAALGGASALLMGFGTELWNALVEGCKATYAYFESYIEEAGGSVIQGLWNGILDALSNVGQWIEKNIFDPFIEGFKDAFGIHSPSKVMQEQGEYIILGLLEGITDTWEDIIKFFSTALSSLQSTLSSAWNSMKSTASTAWNNIKSALSTVWNSIKSNISSTVSNIGSTVSSKWNSMKSTISSSVNSIKSTVSSGFNSVKSSITTKLQSAMSTVKGLNWYSVGSNICTGIRNGINAGWSWLKTTVSNLASNLLSAAKRALGIHSPSRLFRDAVGLNIGYGIGEGIESSEGSIIGTVSGVADAIADEFNANSYTIGEIGVDADGNITQGLNSFSDKIAGSFTNLMNRLQAIADSVSFTIPNVVTGAIPYKAAAVVGSGSGDYFGDKFEASNEELISVLIQSFTSQTAALVDAIQKYSGTTVNLDVDSLTTAIVEEINFRTKHRGKSPLLI